jgi:hypothetical protein
MKKSKLCRFGSGKQFWLCIIARIAAAGKPAENSVINMIKLLLIVSDWPIIMICPSGLLLVVPHLFSLPISSFMGGVAKEYITKLGCEKYFHRITY